MAVVSFFFLRYAIVYVEPIMKQEGDLRNNSHFLSLVYSLGLFALRRFHLPSTGLGCTVHNTAVLTVLSMLNSNSTGNWTNVSQGTTIFSFVL